MGVTDPYWKQLSTLICALGHSEMCAQLLFCRPEQSAQYGRCYEEPHI